MSPSTRRGIRRPEAANAIQKAEHLVAFADTESIIRIWEDLCQLHDSELRDGETHETFPNWILHQISPKAIPQLIQAVYSNSTKNIKSYAPSLCKRFDTPDWKFVLFFGKLSQTKVVALNNLKTARPDITFENLYRELCHIRSQQQSLPYGPFNFHLREIKSCSRSKS